MKAIIDEEKCTACGECLEVCPVDSIDIVDEMAQVDDTCTLCGLCVDVCDYEGIDAKVDHHLGCLADSIGLVDGDRVTVH